MDLLYNGVWKRKGFIETFTLQGFIINNIMLYVGPE